MRTTPIALSLVVLGLLLSSTVPGVVQASSDDRESTCTGEPTDIEELEAQYDADAAGISGTINSPPNLDVDAVYLETTATQDTDSDVFYVTIFHTDLGNANNNIFFNISSYSAVSELQNMEWSEEDGPRLTLSDPSRNASFRLDDDSFEDNICLQISANDPQEPEFDWQFTVSQNNENRWYPAPEATTATPTPTPTATPTPTPTATPTATPTPTPTATPTPTPTATETEVTLIEQETPSPIPTETEQATPTASADGPGFGVVVAMVAVLATILLSRWRQ